MADSNEINPGTTYQAYLAAYAVALGDASSALAPVMGGPPEGARIATALALYDAKRGESPRSKVDLLGEVRRLRGT